MAKQTIFTLDEQSLLMLRREIRRQTQAALHQIVGQSRRSWRPGRGGDGMPLIRFELAENLVPGGQAAAYRLIYVAAEDVWVPDLEGSRITVYDTTALYRGRKRIDGTSSTDDDIRGFRGTATKHPDAKLWEIVNLERGITMFSARIKPPRTVHPEDSSINIFTGADMADEDKKASDATVGSDADAGIKIWQSTHNALWHTTSGQAPSFVTNPLGLSGNDGEHIGQVKMWWKAISQLPNDWSRMDGSNPSEIDFTNPEKFARGYATEGEITNEIGLGTENHTHTINEGVTNIYADYNTGQADEIFTTFSSGDQAVHDPGHDHTAQSAEHLPPYNHLHFIEYVAKQRIVLSVWNDATQTYDAIKIGPGDIYQLTDSERNELETKENAEDEEAREEAEE